MENTTELISQFDELVRCYRVLLDSTCEKEFLRYISNQELLRIKWEETTNECKRLKDQLDAANKDISVLDGKLNSARGWLDAERLQRKKAEAERDCLAHQLEEVRRVLLTDSRYELSDETKRKLAFLNGVIREPHGNLNNRLNTIAESDSAMSSSDVSFSRSDNDIDDTRRTYSKKKHRLSYGHNEGNTPKKRKSTGSSGYFAPINQQIKSIKSLQSTEDVAKMTCKDAEEKYASSAVKEISTRTHNFVSKGLIMPESCLWCSRKMVFGRSVLKCLHCKAVVHSECRDKVPVPCVPVGTSTKKTGGTITEYAPPVSPMIPALVIHCINEIERRGLKEVGIYRICGTDADIRGLREKFSKSKGVPSLIDADVHSICGCLKDFLRNLQDPLIPRAKWEIFANAITASDKIAALQKVVSELPPANRDTLAFLILHLQNVASSPECKMSVPNLATVFGPTVVGYSNGDQINALAEAHTANAVMEQLLSLPNKYWNDFILKKLETPVTIRNVISTDSLMHKSARKFLLTPGGKKKFFSHSPPIY